MTSLNAAGVEHAKVTDRVATGSCLATTELSVRTPHSLAAAAAAAPVAASSPRRGIHRL